MNHHKFSKETIQAVGIILICILTGCFLLLKTGIKKTDIDAVMVDKDTIILQESGNSVSTDRQIPPETETLLTENIELAGVSNANAVSDTASDLDTTLDFQCPIDFESLWETNQDVYAWITIPGTAIDYPILQHEADDSYYLDYTIDGLKGYPGCIYTERVNSKDFTDNNTVIYGHNMRNGTMFTDLHKFREADFFATNDTVYIYTPKKQFTYKIFAAYLYDDRHLLNSFDFSDKDVYSDYLSEIQNMDSEDVNLRKDIKITDTDKIITLITCIREQPEKRVYVQAVLETAE